MRQKTSPSRQVVARYCEITISLNDYKKLIAPYLKEKTDAEVQFWYKSHTTLLAFILKLWLRDLETKNTKYDKLRS